MDDRKVIIYPYGNRWFLPRVEGDIVGMDISNMGNDEVYTWIRATNGVRIQDDRVHAQLLRWFWIHVAIPAQRLGAYV